MNFPPGHWIQPRTANPIESTFGTVELRTKGHPRAGTRGAGTRGADSLAAALAMVCKPAEAARARRPAVTAPHLVVPVRSGARFENGRLVERPEVVSASTHPQVLIITCPAAPKWTLG